MALKSQPAHVSNPDFLSASLSLFIACTPSLIDASQKRFSAQLSNAD